jgi:hypothetical protein
MTIPKERRLSAWRFARPIVKPLLPVCFKIFPATRNIKRYRRAFRRMPNIFRPRTFNEKIQRRILFDRNPRLTLFADKLLVRGFVKSRLGDDKYLTELYAVVASAAEIEQLRLPAKFVMKPNHLSDAVRFVTGHPSVLPEELESLAAKWLRMNFYDVYQEWAYKNIKPCIMFEELLEDDGKVPDDYKFFCFDGEPRFFYYYKDRHGEEPGMNFYDLDMSLLPVRMKGIKNFNEEFRAPPNFEKMLEIARGLSAGVDFVRVDLYNIHGRIVFGELTNYPTNGRIEFTPPEWDLKFGSYWK